MNGMKTALARIEQARQTCATELDLSYLDLTEIPETLAALAGIEVLSLDGNKIVDVAPLAALAGIEVLSLNGNPLAEINDTPAV